MAATVARLQNGSDHEVVASYCELYKEGEVKTYQLWYWPHFQTWTAHW